jgi:hypothetical protein
MRFLRTCLLLSRSGIRGEGSEHKRRRSRLMAHIRILFVDFRPPCEKLVDHRRGASVLLLNLCRQIKFYTFIRLFVKLEIALRNASPARRESIAGTPASINAPESDSRIRERGLSHDRCESVPIFSMRRLACLVTAKLVDADVIYERRAHDSSCQITLEHSRVRVYP